MAEQIKWRIYYADGSTFDGDEFDAPFFGVLCILESDKDHGRHVISNGDYYVLADETWVAVDLIGLIDYLQRPGPRKVLAGRTVPNDLWNDIRARAENDPDFPARTAYGVFERKV